MVIGSGRSNEFATILVSFRISVTQYFSALMCGKGKEEWKNRGTFSVALTTNFDDVLVDACFYFRQIRPLVIHHDSLAPFSRPTQMRPMIVKLHDDHQLAPRNTMIETSELNRTVQDRVSGVLHDRGLVFIDYG